MAWSNNSGSSSGSSSSGGGTKVATNISGRDSIKKPTEGMLVYVVDASDDPQIGSGAATYIYIGGQWVLQNASTGKTKAEDIETSDEKDFVSKEEKEQIDTNKQDVQNLKDKDILIEDNINKNKNDIDDLKSKDMLIDNEITTIKNSLTTKSDIGHTHTIASVTNLQSTLDNKASKIHTHEVSDVNNLQNLLDGKSSTNHTHEINEVIDLQSSLDNKADVIHEHTIEQVVDLQTTLDNKANISHMHQITEVVDLVDTLNGLRTDLNAIDITGLTNFEIVQVNGLNGALQALTDMLVNKADETHTHDASEVTGILDEVESILQSMGFDTSSGQHTHVAAEITDFVAEVQAVISAAIPATHTHEINEINNLQTKIDSKSDTGHTHQIADIAGLDAALQNVSGTAHKHNIEDVNDLQTSLDNKASKVHSHTIAQVNDLQNNLDTLTNGITNLSTNKANITHTHSWDQLTTKPTSTINEIDSSVTKAHEHINKEVIDQLEDAGGVLLYKGTALSGEFMTVENMAERDSIPLDVRSEGMTVLIREDNSMYFLKGGVDNAFWEIFATGAGGAANAVTLPATPSGNLTGVNAQSLFDQLESNKIDKTNVYTKVEVDDKFTNQVVDYYTLDNLPDLTQLHGHGNLNTLSKFGEFQGDLTWDGKTLGNMINDYYDANGDGLVDKAATLEGLTATINELNHSAGLTGNIQAQFDALSSGTIFRGEFETFADMLNTIGGQKGDWVFIVSDEIQGNAKNTQYYHDGNEWIFGGGAVKNPEASLTQSGVIKLGGVLANPNSTAASPQLTNTGVVAGYYSTPNITVGADGRITFIEATDVLYMDDTVISENETWSSFKINDLISNKADKTHNHPQLHDPEMLGKIRLTDASPNDQNVIAYNAVTGKAEWQRQQGGKVYVGSKAIEGDFTLKAGSYVSLFVDEVTKEITINSTFRDGVANGVPTLTEITHSINVPKGGEEVRFSVDAAFNKYMVNVIKVSNNLDCPLELAIYEQTEGGEYEYLSNREYRIHDILSLPITDADQTKKMHLSLRNYGVDDCVATIKIKTTNLI